MYARLLTELLLTIIITALIVVCANSFIADVVNILNIPLFFFSVVCIWHIATLREVSKEKAIKQTIISRRIFLLMIFLYTPFVLFLSMFADSPGAGVIAAWFDGKTLLIDAVLGVLLRTSHGAILAKNYLLSSRTSMLFFACLSIYIAFIF
jgi:hypothetical protein